MKKIFPLLLFLVVSLLSYADPDEIVLNPSGPQKDRSDFPPLLFIDIVTDEIIIDGNGYSAYYDVDIISESTLLTVLSTNVDGDYDTIDVSSLPDDNYTIVITSSNNNEYTGQFTNY